MATISLEVSSWQPSASRRDRLYQDFWYADRDGLTDLIGEQRFFNHLEEALAAFRLSGV